MGKREGFRSPTGRVRQAGPAPHGWTTQGEAYPARASRRLAEQRFRQALGHTILDEILRVRLARVCTLLKETNLPISRITHMCGFESDSHLGVVFRKLHACTMRDYRKKR